MAKKSLFILAVIVVIGSFLRLYQLTHVPPGVNRDEASIGYTAYSLLLTGKDEYGRSFPLSFESFGDWKLPLYIYTTTFFVKIFGLNELAVRLPSALFGIGTIILTYFFVKEIFGQKAEKLALLTSFILAISPWHLHLSRVESESNLAVFLTLLGAILFFKSLKGKKYLIIPSLILFALTYYTYAGNHIFTTLLLLGMFIFYRKQIVKNRWTLLGVIFLISLSFFILSRTLVMADKTKIAGIGMFGDPNIIHEKIELVRQSHAGSSALIGKILHNTATFGTEKFARNYVSSFSPDFLFIKGGTNRAHNIVDFGNMYIVESIFLFLGFAYIVISKKPTNEKFVLYWFLVAPIAASITKDAPHTNRMFAIFPILSLLTGMGILWAIDKLKTHALWKYCIIMVVSGLYVLNFSFYMDRYYIHFSREEGVNWGVGYKSLEKLVSSEKLKDKKIIISKPTESPYIFFLFYSHYDPARYQKEVMRYPPTADKFVHVKSYGRFEFREIDWSVDIKGQNTVLIDSPLKISEFTEKQQFPTYTIELPNGEVQFVAVEVDDRKLTE